MELGDGLDIFCKIPVSKDANMIEVMKRYKSFYVIVYDARNENKFFGGRLNFDEGEPNVYYLQNGMGNRKFHIHDLKQLLIPTTPHISSQIHNLSKKRFSQPISFA